MTKALIIIDYTVDFVADEGKLTAGKPAQAIEESLVNLVKKSYQEGHYLFFAIDKHDLEDNFHPETRLFPAHNLAGSKGRQLYGTLAEVYDSIQSDNRVFWIDKRRYSAFSGTDLDIRLRERKVETVILTGVLTDICLLHTAIDAYNLGYTLEIAPSAVASLTPEAKNWALQHFEKVLGAKVIE